MGPWPSLQSQLSSEPQAEGRWARLGATANFYSRRSIPLPAEPPAACLGVGEGATSSRFLVRGGIETPPFTETPTTFRDAHPCAPETRAHRSAWNPRPHSHYEHLLSGTLCSTRWCFFSKQQPTDKSALSICFHELRDESFSPAEALAGDLM